MNMIIICAWCNQQLTLSTEAHPEVSHGICGICKKRAEAE
jgi:hypothetical protein